MNAARVRQRGIGLIEILIAVVVISLGFLAAAQMQVSSMRNTQGAYYRSQAYFMATEMVDRMRANPDGVREGHYDAKSTGSAAADPGCDAKACTPQQIAAQDLFDWSTHLHALGQGGDDFVPLLPSLAASGADAAVTAAGTITRSADGRYTIRLLWGEIVDGEHTGPDLTLDIVTER